MQAKRMPEENMFGSENINIAQINLTLFLI